MAYKHYRKEMAFPLIQVKKKGGGRLDVGERRLLTFSSKGRLQ
jgi:hypothetical protein